MNKAYNHKGEQPKGALRRFYGVWAVLWLETVYYPCKTAKKHYTSVCIMNYGLYRNCIIDYTKKCIMTVQTCTVVDMDYTEIV